MSTQEVLDEVWGPEPSPSARSSLQNHVTRLRRLLGADAIETVPNGYRLVVADDALDFVRFERGIAAARLLEPAERAEALRAALTAWRGLPLVDAPTSPVVQSAIVQLEELRLDAVESRIDAELALGRQLELVAELEGLVVLHPYRERFWRLLMLALFRSGRQADALATYRRVHRLYASELGLEPSDSLKALQRRILVGDAQPERPKDADDVLLRATLLLPTERETRSRALVEYGIALRRIGEIERADVVLAEAQRLAWEDDGSEAARARVGLTLATVRAFDESESLRSVLAEARRAAGIFDRAGDHTARAAALRTEGQMLRDLGRARDAVAAFEASIEVALAAGASWEEGISRNLLGTAHLYGPTPATAAIAICQRQLSAFSWGPPGPIGLWGSLAWLLAMDGDVHAGRQLALRAVDATRASTPGTYCWSLSILASIDELTGDLATAISTQRAIVEVLDSLGNEGGFALHGAELARLIAREASEEAETLALRSKRAAAADDFSSQVAWRRALARIDGRNSLTLLTEAVALTSRSDMLELRGQTIEDLAFVQAPELARRTLRRALHAFERKGNRLAVARVRRTLESRSL